MTHSAVAIIAVLAALLCLAIVGLCIVALAAIWGEPTAPPTLVHDHDTAEQPRVESGRRERRRGDSIRWRHQLDRELTAANNQTVEAGLLRELERPAWATSDTQPYRHINREGR